MFSNKQRLANLEALLEQDYEKLSYFQMELGDLSHAPSKFELIRRIKREVLPTLHSHEVEYWNLLIQLSSQCPISELEAQTTILDVLQEAGNIRQKQIPEEAFQLLQKIWDKLNEPGTAASAKAKFAVNLIPGILAYEFELDTENTLRQIFNPLKQLFRAAVKKF